MKRMKIFILILAIVCQYAFSLEPFFIIQPYGWDNDRTDNMENVSLFLNSFMKKVDISDGKIIFPRNKFIYDRNSNQILSECYRVFFNRDEIENYGINDTGNEDIIISNENFDFVFVLINKDNTDGFYFKGNVIRFYFDNEQVILSPWDSYNEQYNSNKEPVIVVKNDETETFLNGVNVYDNSKKNYKVGDIIGTAERVIELKSFTPLEKINYIPIFIYDRKTE